MFSFFKSNNPSVVIFYLVYLVLFRIGFTFFSTDVSFVFGHREPLSALLFGFLQKTTFDFNVLGLILGAVLCFIQALLINNIVNSNKFFAKKNYLAGAVFILFASFFKEGLLLTPVSVSLTFIILAVSRIFSLIKKEKLYGDVFDIGFLIAVASLFYFPCTLLLIFSYIGLSTVRPFNYREWIIVMLGFLSPFIIAFTFYFWNDCEAQFFSEIANLHSSGWLVETVWSLENKIMMGGLALCTFACLILLPASLYSSLIQVRKFANILVVLIIAIVVAGALQQTVRLNHLILLALPVGIIASLVLVQIKNKVVSEVIHLILILLVLTGQWFSLLRL